MIEYAISANGGKNNETKFVVMWKSGCSMIYGVKNEQNEHANEHKIMIILWDM